MIYTSLNEIASFNPCPSGWKNILRGQKKTKADDVIFSLVEACESNSISDVCWLLGKRNKEIQIAVRFARMCADSVAHLKNATSAATSAATYAADAADAAADAASAYAADATSAAYADADSAAYASASAAYAYKQQKQKNKEFLIQCILEWNEKEQ
jgi:hypothetical protein